MRLLPSRLQALTILFVDDAPDTTATYGNWLRMRGAYVIEGRSARAAREILGAIAVDIVVTDVSMPHESGVALARFIRDHEQLSRLPIIAVSGVYAPSDPSLVSAPFDAFHTKPLDPRSLQAQIEALVARP
jgi:DNA-binding response OmpR family regulator